MACVFKILEKGGHANLVKCPKCGFEFYANPTPEYYQDHYYMKDHKVIFWCQSEDCDYESSEFISEDS